MSALARPTTPADAFKLSVRAAGPNNPRQYWIENDHLRLEDHDREYVSFSGFYGMHGPEMFAAAPEMAELLWQYRDDLRHPPAPDSIERRLEAINALLSRIEGGEA